MLFDKIKERVERSIAAREFPGCVVGVVSRDGERAVYPFGHLTYDTNAVAVNEDTIYDLASVTKAIPGAALMSDERLNIFGKRGFTGTAVMVHPLAWPEPLSPCRSRRRSAGQRGGGPLQGKAIVILSNATYPTRPLDGGRARHQFRRDIANTVFG